MNYVFHEQLYRGAETLKKIAAAQITICGAGALGANIAENLARTGFEQIRVIDRDRIEERNLSTQPYFKSDIGAQKAKILANSLYRAIGIKVEALAEELNEKNAGKLLKGIVVDCFDNSVSRQTVKDFCLQNKCECLHVGMADGYLEAIWNEAYRVPSDGRDDICDYPLARNLVLLATALASEVLINFIVTGEKQNFGATLRDWHIRELNF
jgi:molybdopterin/thiamine biosynthesis adenylyltransferase